MPPLHPLHPLVTNLVPCRTEKQPGGTLVNGGISHWPRGKVLGGSSMLNYMLYVRGHSKDYDEWRDRGLPGWGYQVSVLPGFI